MKKEYVARVHGTPPESGDWQDLLWKDSAKNKVFVVKRERKGVKPARLEFTRLSAGECSLVRVRLHTGRSHQIRVQFASRRHPLWGDGKYGSVQSGFSLSEQPGRRVKSMISRSRTAYISESVLYCCSIVVFLSDAPSGPCPGHREAEVHYLSGVGMDEAAS